MIHLGDITKINGCDATAVNVVIGGSPCQDLSVAGKRAGFDGERSVLFLDQIRIIKEMRERDERYGRTGVDVRPRFMVWENVPGAFSSRNGEDFRCVLEETARVKDPDAVVPGPPKGKWSNAGCILGDGWSIAWRVLDAQFWGVPQRRRRIALVADFGGHAAPEILFERSGLSGDSETGRTAGEGTAGDVENGVGAAVFGETGIGYWQEGVQTLRAEGENRPSRPSHVVCLNDQGGSVMGVSGDVTGTLRAQEHGHQPVVIGCTNRGIACEKTETLRAESHGAIPMVMGFKPWNSEKARTLGREMEKAPSLETSANAAICIQGNVVDRDANCNGKGWKEEKAYTLNTIDRPAVYAIDNHPQDSRVTLREGGIVRTLSKQCGTGGGNVPMCMIQQAIGEYKVGDIASFCKQRDHKDATDLI